MRYEGLIALRYTRSRKRAQGRNRFISFISLVSVLGNALGVAALIVVLSVMNGFQEDLRTRILGMASHVIVNGYNGGLTEWQQVVDETRQNKAVLAAAPFVQEQSMLTFEGAVRGAMVRGILPAEEAKVTDLDQIMKSPSSQGSFAALTPGRFGMVIGRDIAVLMGARVGDKVTVMAPQGLVTPAAVVPRVKQFEVVGIFEAGYSEYDGGLVFIHMTDAQTLYRMGDAVTGVRLKTDDIFNAPRVARDIAGSLTAPVSVTDWTRTHANFFRAVALEKKMLGLILFLIVAVAAFNIVSTLVMVVQEKYADIAILRTLGASPASIMGIFVFQGALIGVAGVLMGLTGGLLLAKNLNVVIPAIEKITGMVLWNKDVYYLAEMPSKVLWSDVSLILSASFLLTLLMTLYPSWRAARVNPAEALRYE